MSDYRPAPGFAALLPARDRKVQTCSWGLLLTGIVIFAHGSRIESANEAVRSVAAELARQDGFSAVEAAFLELGSPDLNGAVEKLAQRGARRVIVVPYFLTLGLHLERDLPRLVQAASLKFKDLEVVMTAPLDGHPALIEVLRDRASSA
jgi:sirohydrochlorin ferrochelatase